MVDEVGHFEAVGKGVRECYFGGGVGELVGWFGDGADRSDGARGEVGVVDV